MKKFENILVAFDLNKTLFFKSQSPLPRRHDCKVKKLFFYLRPHLKDLTQFLHSNQINYCFWSNMMGKNCVKYVRELELIGMNKHCGIFDQEFCDRTENMVKLGQKVKSLKNLHKLAALFQIDVDNCILVDDSKEKNVEGCHLIHLNSFEGQEEDKELLMVIEKLREFRKIRVNEKDEVLEMLKFTEYKFQSELDHITLPKIMKLAEKKTEPTEIELLVEKDPQLKKFKTDLAAEKSNRKEIIKEIEMLEKSNLQMAEEVKKKSQGKVVRKGDQLLVEVLMFAKNKKAAEKKLEELKQKKKDSEQKIDLIKKLMKMKLKELEPKAVETKEEVNKEKTQQEHCLDEKEKKEKQNSK